jgi:ABC-2 type transport system ATP-binding protein/ribosome-dependent ATPase
MMTEPLAEGLHVTRRFGAAVAVRDVSVTVRPGEVLGLLGANGAGKTTLLRMLLGLLPPSEGAVRLFGRGPSLALRRHIGYMPQGMGLYEDLTPEENLRFARAVFGVDLSLRRNEFPDVPVGALPLGLQRRVAFRQVLQHRPRLLVLDEPTSGVDPLMRARLWQEVRAAADQGAGVLITTHHMEEAEQCDRLVVMADGRVVAEGGLEEILAGEEVVLVEIADWAQAMTLLETAGYEPALVGRSLRLAASAEPEVRRVLSGQEFQIRRAPATLEERFVALAARRS